MHLGDCYCAGVYGNHGKVTDDNCDQSCHDTSPGGLNCGGGDHRIVGSGPRYFYIYQLGENHCSISGISGSMRCLDKFNELLYLDLQSTVNMTF